MQTTTPSTEAQRLRTEIRRAIGRLEVGDKDRAIAQLKKALNEREPRCTKSRPV